jgi:hypothetical protein
MELRIEGSRATRDIDLALCRRIRAKGEPLTLRIAGIMARPRTSASASDPVVVS